MFDIVQFPLFLVSVIILCITPGPDLAFIIGQSMSYGRRSGIISSLGVSLGCSLHVLACSLGLSALIYASHTAFTILKYLGAIYLIYLGITYLKNKNINIEDENNSSPTDKLSHIKSFFKGFLINVTNPKVILFFLSFFPQFVSTSGSHNTISFLLLGAVFIAITLLNDILFACLSGKMSRSFKRSPLYQAIISKTIGVVFLYLGVKLSFLRG